MEYGTPICPCDLAPFAEQTEPSVRQMGPFRFVKKVRSADDTAFKKGLGLSRPLCSADGTNVFYPMICLATSTLSLASLA